MFRFVLVIFSSAVLVACNGCGSSPDYDSTLPVAPSVPPPSAVIYKILNVYPHDTSSFTQGLEFHDGKLWESTGELEHSKISIVDPVTGIAAQSHTLTDPEIFGEGLTILNNKVYQLTWRNNRIFEYDINDITQPVKIFPWEHEGWGVTNNGRQLIISDGSGAVLYFVTPDETSGRMVIDKTLTVRSNLGLIDNLNEIELINGQVYANRWHTDDIYIIDTTSGFVTGTMNFKGILNQYDPGAVLDPEAVLNGIAYDSTAKKIYITGKLWPKVFEIELVGRE